MLSSFQREMVPPPLGDTGGAIVFIVPVTEAGGDYWCFLGRG